MSRAPLVAAAVALATAGCCPIFSVRVGPHVWNVIVRHPKEDLASLPRDRPLGADTCAMLCPRVEMSPGGPITAHLRSCHLAPLDGEDVVICRGDTEGSCVERSFGRRADGSTVAIDLRCGAATRR